MIGSLTDPAFISLLIGNKNSVLVLEDCENYIAERTSFNSNTDVVSSILNIADGMLSDVLECQLICTFNSDISKIDSALLRKGRLIAEYKFKELTVEKCNKYLQSTDRDFRVDKPYSLAELTNIDIKELKEQDKQTKIGFKKMIRVFLTFLFFSITFAQETGNRMSLLFMGDIMELTILKRSNTIICLYLTKSSISLRR